MMGRSSALFAAISAGAFIVACSSGPTGVVVVHKDSGTTASGPDAGSCTAAASVPLPPVYTPVTNGGACSMAKVMSWTAACDSSTSTNATCTTWAQDPANAACAACIQPAPTDGGEAPASGAIIYDQSGNPYLNLAGCVAVADGNTACAAPLEQLLVCQYDACGSDYCLTTATQTEYDDCLSAADVGACSSYANATGPCATDAADGGTINVACATPGDVIYVICGNGS